MKFLHINLVNYNVKNGKGISPLDELNKELKNGKKVFILFYMEGCGPCNATRPEWKKMKNILQHKYKNLDEFIVVDIDQELIDKIETIKNKPMGFPTMQYIDKGGDFSQDYEDSEIELKDRSVDSFVDWVDTKVEKNTKNTNEEQQTGGKRKSKRLNKSKKRLNKSKRLNISKKRLNISKKSKKMKKHLRK
jgi:thiol-disulfide isomerase/thioredoxin